MGRRRKKPIARPSVQDPDDLFALLLEQAIPSTPDVWFQPPWNDGRNAIWLGARLIECFYTSRNEDIPLAVTGIIKFLEDSTEGMDIVDGYWTAQELKGVAKVSSHHASALVAILDMAQKRVAQSDGGGHVYNSILQRLCESFLQDGGEGSTIEPLIRKWRARDAVGLFPSDEEPQDQSIQRRLRAFEMAWQRGLFKVAYCI